MYVCEVPGYHKRNNCEKGCIRLLSGIWVASKSHHGPLTYQHVHSAGMPKRPSLSEKCPFSIETVG